jgi:lysozyme
MAKKKKNAYLVWILLIAMLTSCFLIFKTYYFPNPSKKFYKDFGIDIPSQYTIHGIDVSKYQSTINWELVKAMKVKNIQIGFVFIKATEGISTKDYKFRYNWENAGKNNIKRGAYHYFLPHKNPVLQANNFVQTVQLKKGDLPPVVDIEDLAGVQPQKMILSLKKFLNLLENHYHVKPIIYSYANFYNNNLKDDFLEYPLWIAHYKEKNKPDITRPWQFWQHSEEGHVNGISHKVDFNVFNGDSSDFKKLLLQ